MSQPAKYERVAVFIFGAVFVVAILAFAVAFPEPTAFQYTVFRIVLALAAAGVAAFIPGFIHIKINTWLRAGGAMAVFAVVYFFSPAQLAYKPQVPKQGKELIFVTESAKSLDDGGLEVYFTVWNRHPYENLRLTDVRLQELERIPTEFYFSAENRSELSLNVDLSSDVSNPSGKPLNTTYEIAPLSSHTFVARVAVKRGFADDNPVVWFGLDANYSTPSGTLQASRSDRIFLANATRSGLPVAYSDSELAQLLKTDTANFIKLDPMTAQEWFSDADSATEIRGSSQ